MATHPKALDTQIKDRRRLQQVALLWWSHQIYEQASKASDKDLKAVLRALASARTTLEAIEQGPKFNQSDADARMHMTLGSNNERQRPTALTELPCDDTLDCPEDYICENYVCVYMFPDPKD